MAKIRHVAVMVKDAKTLKEFYEQAFGLDNGQMNHARNVLRRYGNMSSPTVLFVLQEFLSSGEIHPAEYGLVTALGPGFSSEMLLIQG